MSNRPLLPALRLLLVDDHTIVREGLKRILESTAEGWDITEESSGFQALDSLRRARFDLAIVDLSMPGMSGLELIRRIRAEFSPLPVLVLSMHAEDHYALRALRAGAAGYVNKESAAEDLSGAVRKVLAGGTHVSTRLAETLAKSLRSDTSRPAHDRLSDRELEVLRGLAGGKTVKQIGVELALSEKTVSTYRTRLLEKMQMHTNAELIQYALREGLVE